MQKKTRLMLSDNYGRVLVATRCAELIDAGEFGGAGPVRLRVEVSAHALWDDLVEEYADGSVHGWQVKHQRTPLDRDTMAAQLSQLAQSSLSLGHLALLALENIPGVGSLVSLAELCERLRQPQLDWGSVLRSMPGTQRKWLDFGRKEAGLGSDEDCLRTLQRLNVFQLGPIASLDQQLLKDLRRWYEDPKGAKAKLLDFLARHPDEAVGVDYPLLRDQVLAGHPPAQRRGQTSARQREQYLQAVLQAHAGVPLLNGLDARVDATEAPLRLEEVFVPPRLRLLAPHSKGGEPDPEEVSRPSAREPRGRAPGDPAPRPGLPTASRPLELRELVDALLLPEKLPSRVLLIEAPVGSGKSMLLGRLSHDLARAGLDEVRAPLPLLVDAVELAGGRLEDAARRKLSLPEGLSRPEPEAFPYVYLVDGLDEVPPRDVGRVAQELVRLAQHPRTVALVLTSRPGIAFTLPRTPTRLHVAPWSGGDIERFLERWRQHRPTQVEAMGAGWRHEPLRSAMSNPLTATLSLLLAGERPEVLGNRTALFGGLVDKLFQEWARLRPLSSNAPSWSDISGPLRKLALETVRAEQDTLAEPDLRKRFKAMAPARDVEWLNAASTHFGLLVRQGHGTYRFVLRSLAEYLAGEELYTQGTARLVPLAARRWAEEPVRHAIGITARQEGIAAALTLLQGILPPMKTVLSEDAHTTVRATLVAARAAQDLGKKAHPIAEQLAEPLVALLTEPTSTWIPERMSEVVQVLAREGGPCWDAVLERVRERLHGQELFAVWAATVPFTQPKEGLTLLRVSDIRARAVVTHRLARWVDEPEARDALLLQLFDAPGYELSLSGTITPILAGLALRRAKRDALFVRRVKPALLQFLNWSAQLPSGCAALALLPEEADTEQLAEALAQLGMHHPYPREVLEELVAAPGGKKALTQIWPEWSNELQTSSIEDVAFVTSSPAPRTPPPLTEFVLPVVARAIGPALARMSTSERSEFGLKDNSARIALLCEHASEHPRGIVSALETISTPTYFSIDAQLALQDAAARHPTVVRALLDLWKRDASDNFRSHFPGLALDTRIAEGDDEAARVFAEWLVQASLFKQLARPPPISLATLRHPVVRNAALTRVREAWKQHTEEHLPFRTIATLLGSLRPVWEDDTALQEALRQRVLATANFGTFLAEVMITFWELPLPVWLTAHVLTRLEATVDDPEEMGIVHVAGYLTYAERVQELERLRPRLDVWTTQASWLRYKAAISLLGLLTPPEAEALSARCAEHWPQAWQPTWNSDTDLSRLVAANPQAWHERLRKLLEGTTALSHLLSGVPLFELAQTLLPRLTREEQQALLAQLGRTLGHFQHPWLANDAVFGVARRPADFFHELVFDNDVEEDTGHRS